MVTKLIVGLGNPGQEYKQTRHNAGFMLLDAYTQKLAANWHEKQKYKSEISEITKKDTKIIHLKPLTYMNRSGEAVRAVKDFYKIDNGNILILHDELALPFGTVRTRIGGSDAGNNGIKSIIQHIGSDFARIRIGILNDELPIMGATDFVLDRFDPEELAQLQSKLLPTVSGFTDDFIDDKMVTTTQTH